MLYANIRVIVQLHGNTSVVSHRLHTHHYTYTYTHTHAHTHTYTTTHMLTFSILLQTVMSFTRLFGPLSLFYSPLSHLLSCESCQVFCWFCFNFIFCSFLLACTCPSLLSV